MSDDLIALGNRIKALRKEKGVTQEQLAEMIDRSKNHISKIELGMINFPVSLLFSIAKSLQVEPYELFTNKKDSIELPQNLSSNDLDKIVTQILLQKFKEFLKILNMTEP